MSLLELTLFFDELLETCPDDDALCREVGLITSALNAAISNTSLNNGFETDCSVEANY